MINFDDWQKLDLRIGEIINVEDHPNADKLLILNVDLGNEKRQLVAGLKQYYKKEELIGKKIVIFTNLKPTMLRGVESQGMLLAAIDKDKVALLIPDKDIANGSKIS